MPKTILVRNFFEITESEWRVVTAVEIGMRNHEYVDLHSIHQAAGINHDGASFVKILRNTLIPKRIIAYENTGYRLTNLGYDFLALHNFVKFQIISDLSFFQLIGTGKESDIYICRSGHGSLQNAGIPLQSLLVLKFHRLGRTSFKQVVNKREYKKGNKCSWMHLNRISCAREFVTMQALYRENLPVPVPIFHNRGAVAMEFLKNSYPLFKFSKTVMQNGAAETLFKQASKILIDMAKLGLVHGDLNEFNLMVETAGNGEETHVGNYQDDIPCENDDVESDIEEDIDNAEDEDTEEDSDYSDNDETDEDEDLVGNDNDCCPYLNDDIDSFKMRVIDFPQAISRDNKIAQEIYSRDRHGIISFFSKFAKLNDEDLPPVLLSDIERIKYVDVQLKAPGHPKKIDLRRQNIEFDNDSEDESRDEKIKEVMSVKEIKKRIQKEQMKKAQKGSISKHQRNTKKGQFRNDIASEL